MTDVKALADRIDPRIDHLRDKGRGWASWQPETADLIAASDALRATALPEGEVSELVKLTDIVALLREHLRQRYLYIPTDDPDQDGEFDGAIITPESIEKAAASMLTLLQSQVDVARKMALNEAARVAENAAATHEAMAAVHKERQVWELAAQRKTAACDAREIMDRIRSLSPTVDMDAMVEKGARAMLAPEVECHIQQIQGFLYGSHHVIRDCTKPPGEQEIHRTIFAKENEERYELEHAKVRARAILSAIMGRGEPLKEEGR